MKDNILEFVRDLSKKDSKTLAQRALKTTEELGELSKAILPFESAAGTLHRFVHKRQILENAIDVMLCAYSIAYELGYEDQDIQDMMKEKAIKWSNIQHKEGKTRFPLPFEVHITVDALHDERSINIFKEVCERFKVKPIIIELERDGNLIMNDIMTSSIHFGDNTSAIQYANKLGRVLDAEGYKVLRVKIETVPWHPAAPSTSDPSWEMPKNSYFESHLRIVTTRERKSALQAIAKHHKAHLSRNFFKKINDSEFVIMMTLRSNNVAAEQFQEDVNMLKEHLISNDFIVDKTEIEFAVYDTNVNHDIKWIKEA